MALLPKVKLKSLVSFPAAVFGGTGIAVRKENGNFYFDLDYADFAPPVGALIPADEPHLNALLWNNVKDEYLLAPISLLGGGGGGGIPEAPNDGVQYGRQSLGWTPITGGGGGGIPEAPTDGKLYGRSMSAWAPALPISGGTLTGPLILNGNPTTALGAATKQYVDASAGGGGNFTQIGTGAVPYGMNTKNQEIFNARDFGVTGDGSTDDYAKINIAIAAAVANGKSLAFSDGVYCHSGTIVWAYPRFRVIALGANVTFKHTGSGIAHNFNGQINGSASEGVFRNVFGGPNKIHLMGNPAGGTTMLCYLNNFNWSSLNISGRDANFIVYGENTGAGQASCVESVLDIDIRPGSDGALFAVRPQIGIRMDMCYASTFVHPTVEHCGAGNQPAMQLTNSNGNLVLAGTLESNLATGLYVGPGCNRNTFINLHNEANDGNGVGAVDFNILGNNNHFIGCAGAATAGGQSISGSRNLFETCVLQSVHVVAGANDNMFDHCQFLGTWSDAGLRTIVIAPDAVAPSTGFGLSETTGTWTPTDNSGGGLTFGSVTCKYTKHGNTIHAYGTLTYPNNSNALTANIIGLPFPIPVGMGVFPSPVRTGGGQGPIVASLNSGGTAFQFWNNGANAFLNNSQLSTQTVYLNILYPAS